MVMSKCRTVEGTKHHITKQLKAKCNGPELATYKLKGERERNVLFNDALNTFYLRLYGVRHMVKDHSDSERKPAAAT